MFPGADGRECLLYFYSRCSGDGVDLQFKNIFVYNFDFRDKRTDVNLLFFAFADTGEQEAYAIEILLNVVFLSGSERSQESYPIGIADTLRYLSGMQLNFMYSYSFRQIPVKLLPGNFEVA